MFLLVVGGPSLPLDSLPLAAAQEAHSKNVKAAEAQFAKNQALLKESKEAMTSKTLTEEELARRKEFLSKQRELLLKKKKAERENDLAKIEQEKSQLEQSQQTTRSLTDEEQQDIKRQALKGALVQHLKTVHTEVESKRAAVGSSASSSSSDAAKSVDTFSLQQQFAEMEEKRKWKEAQLKKDVELREKQELERKQTMLKLAESMAKTNL